MSVIVHCVISASLICNIYLEMLVINIYLKQRFATFEMLKYYIFLVSRNVNGQHFLHFLAFFWVDQSMPFIFSNKRHIMCY